MSNRWRIKYTISFFSLLLSFTIGYSSTVKFYNINYMFGIAMREAYSVCEDENGFIWASTKTGVLRLTNDDVRIYQLPYEATNVVTVKLVYRYPNLVAFTSNGQVFLYNEFKDRFESILNINKALNSNFTRLSSVLVDPGGCYWIASSGGMFKYQNHKLTLANTERMRIVRAIWADSTHILLSTKNSLFTFNIRTGKYKYVYDLKNDILSSISCLTLTKNRKKLWVGTLSDGILYYDFGKKQICFPKIKSFPKQPVFDIEPYADSLILVGIDGQGIWEMDNSGNKVINIYKEDINSFYSLRGNGVYDIFCDNEERVWVCTYSGGVSFFEQDSPYTQQITHQINNRQSLVNNDVNSIIQDKKGRLWFATNNGISRWDKKNNSWLNLYNSNRDQTLVFLTLCEDNKGQIWAGSYSSGIYIIDENSGKQLAHYASTEKNSPINNNFVFDIFKDSEGDIWMGGINSEIRCYHANENRFQTFTTQPLNSMAELSKNEILLGCSYGLLMANKKTSETSYLLNGYFIQDILVMGDNIWLGTNGNGLMCYNYKTGDTVKYNIENGLPSNYINSIQLANGYLWLGTENGLCRFNPEDKSVLTYSSIVSLAMASFNRNAQCTLNDGQLAWGTNYGAILFNPDLKNPDNIKGKIYFQDMSISGNSIRKLHSLNLKQPLNNLKEINLKYNQNAFTLELLPLGVVPGSKFSWKLEGLDENWTNPSYQRIVSYNNINPGDYMFKVRLYDNSLTHIIQERDLAINIKPPFWKTWYFSVFLFLFLTLLIYLSLWYYINLLKHQHAEEKVRFFTNTAHDIRTSLTLIKAPVEELSHEKKLSESGRYYLNLAKEQAARLYSVATQLMDFQKVDVGKGQLVLQQVDIVKIIRNRLIMFESFAKGREVKLNFTANPDSFIASVDEIKIEKVIDNLISNAIKYSYQKGEIKIVFNGGQHKFTIEVADRGIGISKKAQRQLFKEFYRGENAMNSKIVGSGIGLLLVKNYINMHGGSISYNSEENKGSQFMVTIPVKEIRPHIQESPKNNDSVLAGFNENITKTITENIENPANDLHILIVEDNDELRNFMHHALNDAFEILATEDGIPAWETIQKQLPDLVVSDIMMPDMDGFELCRLIKSTFETSHIPVILLTALTGKAEQLRGLGLGADDYLTKPFDIALLRERIKTIIKNREIVRNKALKLIKDNTGEPVLSNNLNDQFVRKMVHVVRDNMANSGFNKNAFAAAMNVSSSLLYKKLKSITNQSPTDFIKIVRLNYSLELLQTKKHTVTEVSELSGFTSVGYFSTVFKKHFGKSPTEIL